MSEKMNDLEIEENADVFEDYELQDLLGGVGSLVPLDDIPEEQLID